MTCCDEVRGYRDTAKDSAYNVSIMSSENL